MHRIQLNQNFPKFQISIKPSKKDPASVFGFHPLPTPPNLIYPGDAGGEIDSFGNLGK